MESGAAPSHDGPPSAEGFFVSRTMDALEVLAFAPSTAPEVAAALKVHPRTARRLLNRLVVDGWATRSDGHRRRYAPSLRLLAMASQFAARTPLTVVGAPIVEKLHQKTGRTVSLVIPSYTSALCIVRRSAGENGRPHQPLTPAHASAGGKLLMAYREPWAESVLKLPLVATTQATITHADALRRELDLVRDRGYAVDNGELAIDRRGLAMPVKDPAGDVIAALELYAPAAEDLSPVAAEVASAASRVGDRLDELGGRPLATSATESERR